MWLLNGPLALNDEVAIAADGTLKVLKPGLISLVRQLPWWVPVGVIGLTLAALGLQVLRIAMLMSAMGFPPGWKLATRAYLVGLFYGNLIPAGQVGGDPVKAWILAKGSDSGFPLALAAVTVDRAAGLAVLAAIALVTMTLVVGDPRYAELVWLMGAFVAVALLGLLVLANGRVRRWTGASWLVLKLSREGGRREAFIDGLRRLGGARGALAGVALLSLASHCLLIAAAALVGAGIQGTGLSLGDYFALVPPASFISSVPGSTPGGWGIGEGAYVLLFGAVGVAAESAALISVLPRLAVTVISLAGLPWSFGRLGRPG